jgi:hypothetical protein
MIVLDENIPEDQCQLLRRWRIRFRQVGRSVGRKGMKDQEHILPLLHELNRPTFFTRDLGFFDEDNRHSHYAIVCLAVSQKEVALYVRRFLRHPSFDTNAKRIGAVVYAMQDGMRGFPTRMTKCILSGLIK